MKQMQLIRARQEKSPMPKIPIGAFLLIVAVIGAPVAARPTIRTSFFNEYPQAVGTTIETVPSHTNHCGQCHFDFNGGGTRNAYGIRLGQVIGNYSNNDAGRRQAMRFIENEFSDADAFSNIVEISDTVNYTNTPTFAGLTPANVGSVSNVNVAEIQDHLVPVTGPDVTPPVVTVIAPNGGEMLTGNGGTLVQWSATDASGIAAADIYLSTDNGASFKPLALGLGQTGDNGSHTVFIPNRPTSAALIRVRATDNASHSGQDESNAVFTVQSPMGGIAPTTLRDFDLPGTQPFDAGSLNPPTDCSPCHGNYDTAVEPYFNWQGSMMAHASRDLLFEACMTVANQDAPDSGDLCLRCHISSGWLQGRSIPTSGAQMLSTDMFGVSCDLCHRMVDSVSDPANPAEDTAILAALANVPDDFGNGMYVVDPVGTRRRGPYSSVSAPHAFLFSPFHREAAHCGTCHDVSNPAFTKDGSGHYPPNPFDAPPASTSANDLMPIERTYSEWLNSEYASTGVHAPQFSGRPDGYVYVCQDCHMKAVSGRGCNTGPIRDDLPLHDMTGGSTWLASLLPTLYPGEVNAAAIEAGVLRARAMLQKSASLAVNQNGEYLDVTVTNESGHKLPTGYPEGRRVWLNVKFYDDVMTLLGESGAYDASTGVLTHDEDVKIYEAKPGLDTDTASLVGVSPGPSFHFVLNNKIYKDNRIPPRGFTNLAFAQFGGTPVGAAYADGQFWDDTSYAIPFGASSATVTLYYQSTSKEYVEFLQAENITDTKGDDLFNLWNNNGKCPPETIATVTLPLEVVPVAGDIDGDGDVDFDDSELFVGVLIGVYTQPAYVTRADLNGDELSDGRDSQLFVEAMLASPMRNSPPGRERPGLAGSGPGHRVRFTTN
ncbi:hypothetical protein B7486_09285 [cyanobacterium TDX16]|nr:hypothetical protein B7486_09285 [cyanobacterium TDX16]